MSAATAAEAPEAPAAAGGGGGGGWWQERIRGLLHALHKRIKQMPFSPTWVSPTSQSPPSVSPSSYAKHRAAPDGSVRAD